MLLALVGCASSNGGDGNEFGGSVSGDVYQVTPVACIGEIHVRATAMAVTEDLVATAAHSFEAAVDANLLDRDGNEVEAEIVYADFDKDIALLRISPNNNAIFNGAEPVADQEVRIVSYFDDEEGPQIKTGGVLRVVRVTLDGEGSRRALELEAEIERGDSGGPVLDRDGNVVAMVFASSRGKTRGWAVTYDELQSALADYEAGAPLELPISCDQ